MKKILLVAPIGKDNAVNGGYNKVANNLNYVLNLFKEKYNYEFDSVHPTELFTVEQEYDVVLFQCHPSTLINNLKFSSVFKEKVKFFKKCYLHIAWETSPFPSSWTFLDSMFDGYIANSEFCVFEMKKISKKPVYCFPFYIEDSFLEHKLSIEDKKNEKEFTVLFMGQNTKRKGIEDAINAFCVFAQGKNDVKMIVKYHNLSNKEIPVEQLIESSVSLNSYLNVPEIYTIDYELNEEQIVNTYKNSSVLLFPSKGEGFGLPILESNLVGIPVIHTDWSSMQEVGGYCRSINIPLKYDLSSAIGMSTYKYEFTSIWANPKFQEIIIALELLYIHWKKDKVAYYEKCLSGTKHLQKLLNSKKNEFLEEVIEK